MDLSALAETIRTAPGLVAKRDVGLAGRLGALDGDDAALVPDGDGWLVLCAEAIDPGFAASDPFAAGAAAVATNVSDVRAMGGRPMAIVDTVVSPDREHAGRVLDGLAWASRLHGVPVVGGHLTIGGTAAVSAACTGRVRRPLRASAVRPGDVLIAAVTTEGEYRGAAPFWSSLRHRDPDRIRTDGEALVEVAERGLCHAARDVSMPGIGGSLLQMLEATGAGAVLRPRDLPRPAGVPLERWLVTFPSFGFVLAAAADAVADALAVFAARDIAAAACGEADASGVLRLADGDDREPVWDLRRTPVTGLGAG
jgi:uncharacterized protein